MIRLPPWTNALARVLLSLLFLVSGVTKLVANTYIQGYMHAYGVPGLLSWPAAALELSGGILLVLGRWVRPVALVLSGWCILTAAIFHTAFADPIQQLMFLKNMTMAGGFLLIARSGAPGWGLDACHEARA